MNDAAPATVLLVLGSNIEPRRNLERAMARLAEELEVEAVSSVWESEPHGAPGTPRFLNAAVRISCSLGPLALRSLLRGIEAELGRRRVDDRNAPRTIDLDIAVYGRRVIDDRRTGLRIPDPQIPQRAYLAVPLAEVGPELVLPGSGERLADIAERLACDAESLRRLDLDLAPVSGRAL